MARGTAEKRADEALKSTPFGSEMDLDQASIPGHFDSYSGDWLDEDSKDEDSGWALDRSVERYMQDLKVFRRVHILHGCRFENWRSDRVFLTYPSAHIMPVK